MTLTDAVLVGVLGLLAAYLLLVLAFSALRPLRTAVSSLFETLTAPFTATMGQLGRDVRWRGLEKELQRALGQVDDLGSQERADVVEAAMAAQEIVVLDRLLRESVRACLGTHWLIADALQVDHMSEAARHPRSAALRQRIVDLTEVLSRRLERYPLLSDSPELLRLQLGLTGVAPACCACPYWVVTRSAAPRICPTAKALVHPTRPSSDTIIDAELVDDADGETS